MSNLEKKSWKSLKSMEVLKKNEVKVHENPWLIIKWEQK